jgi:hypothetical protein
MNDVQIEPLVEQKTAVVKEKELVRAPEEGTSKVISGWERFVRGRAFLVQLFADPPKVDAEMN